MRRHHGNIRVLVGFLLLGLVSGAGTPLAASPRPLVLAQQPPEVPSIEAFLSTADQGTFYDIRNWDPFPEPLIPRRGRVDDGITPPFDWGATFIGCGTFTVMEVEEDDDDQEIQALAADGSSDGPSAFWSHPNGTGPGLCPHTGFSHPGVIVVEFEQPTPLISGTFADEVWQCVFIGSGTPDVVEEEPCDLVPSSCEVDVPNRNVLVEAKGGTVTMTVDTSDTVPEVFVGLDDGSLEGCRAPIDSIDTITVNGSVADEHVELDLPGLSQAFLAGLRISLDVTQGDAAHGTAFEPRDEMTIRGRPGQDVLSFQRLPGVPGGMGVDVNGDGAPDIVNQGVEVVQVFGGGGGDIFKVPIDAVPRAPRQGLPSLYFTGEAGADRLEFTGTGGNNTITFGMSALVPGAPGPYRPALGPAQLVAAVNLTPGADMIVDVTALGVEKWSVFGKGGKDVLSGAGGRGTGSAFQFPLILNGDAGKDTLTGGKKKDVLDGGPGSDTCHGSGKDVERSCEH